MGDVLDDKRALGFTITHVGRVIVATHRARPETFTYSYDNDDDAQAARVRLARQCLDAMLGWLADDPRIAKTFDSGEVSPP